MDEPMEQRESTIGVNEIQISYFLFDLEMPLGRIPGFICRSSTRLSINNVGYNDF
jgi:hypothetical protein